ncbi:unnamed protein product [Gulo gulo]|uniref:Uncharacterized protein n=1 Tax=Gulo gulo TaxID=48420 RepID=A0A9X9Q8W4_GULGU|nr:unnamed protein product [Gulo gulo]
MQSPNSYFLGGCEVSRMLQNQYHLWPCTNSTLVCWLLHCPLPVYRRKSKAYRWMLLQMEAELKSPLRN